MVKKILSIIACLLLILPFLTKYDIAYAAGKSEVYIKAYYSSNIEPKENDIFELTYMAEGGEETAVITIDAYKYVDEEGYFELPEGTYQVVDIHYTGDNEDIINEGYAVNRDFKVETDSAPFLKINIGKSAATALFATSSGVIMQDPTGDINESRDKVDEDSQKEDDITEETPKEDEEIREYKPQSSYSAAASGKSSNVKVIKPSTEPKKNKESPTKGLINMFTKIGVIFIIGIIGIGIMYIFHKKGKI